MKMFQALQMLDPAAPFSCKKHLQYICRAFANANANIILVCSGIKERQAARQCVPLAWHRWKELLVDVIERSTGRPSSGTPTTILFLNLVLGQ